MDAPRSIVLVSVDDLRRDCVVGADSPDWLETYGAADALETPTMDDLAAGGVSFERCTSASSYTPPSHASLFTGAYPSEHGVKTFFNRLDGQRTIAEALSAVGYETLAWVENMALPMLDVTAGFDRVVCPFEDPEADLFDFVADAAVRDRVFVFIHLFDVHKPYGYTTGGSERTDYNGDYPDCLDDHLPDGVDVSSLVEAAATEAAGVVPNYAELTDPLREYADYRSLDYLLREALEEEYGAGRFKHLVRLYVEGVNRFDRNRLPDLLAIIRASLLDEYLFVFTSDHGETRCRWDGREDLMNSFNISEGAVRVPLVIDADSGRLDGLVSPGEPVSHVDVFPTILDAAGLDPTSPSGRSLFRSLPDDRPLFNESWFYSGGADFFGNLKRTGEGGLSEVAVRVGDRKLVRSFAKTGTPNGVVRRLDAPIPEDTAVPDDAAERKPLERILDMFLDGLPRSCSPDIGPDQDAMEDRLRALGYLE